MQPARPVFVRALPLIGVSALVLLLSGGLGSPVVAGQDLAVRIRPKGFVEIAPVLKEKLPSLLPVSATSKHLFNCPGDDIIAHIPDLEVALHFSELNIVPMDGALSVAASVDLRTGTTVTINEAYACFGTAVCDVDARARNVRIRVVLAPALSDQGAVELHRSEVHIDLAPDDFSVASEGCALGDAAEWLIEAFDGFILSKLLPRLEATVQQELKAKLADILNEQVAKKISVGSFSLRPSLNQLSLNQRDGFTVAGSLAISWETNEGRGSISADGMIAGTDQASFPKTKPPEGYALPQSFGDDAFELAFSDRLVTHALYAAWQSGLLSSLVQDRIPLVTLSPDETTAQVGIKDGTSVAVSFEIEQPPQAFFGRDGSDAASLSLPQLGAHVTLTAPGEESRRLSLALDATASVKMAIDQTLGAMTAVAEELTLHRLRFENGTNTFDIDAERLRAVVRDIALPLVHEQLAGVPLIPALHSVLDTFAYIAKLETRSGWQRVSVALAHPNPNDKVEPNTYLVEPQDYVGPHRQTFAVAGEDNDTPSELLRFVATVDDVPVEMGNLSGIRLVKLNEREGEHVLRVAAVDLAGNQDSSAAEHQFYVDATPPVLSVTDEPLNVLQSTTVSARWQASDDGGQVESRWYLKKIGSDGEGIEIASVGFDDDLRSMRFSDLELGALYELVIVARDRANNVSSQSYGFAVNPSTGCSVDAVPPRSGVFIVLLLLLVPRAAFRVLRRMRHLQQGGSTKEWQSHFKETRRAWPTQLLMSQTSKSGTNFRFEALVFPRKRIFFWPWRSPAQASRPSR